MENPWRTSVLALSLVVLSSGLALNAPAAEPSVVGSDPVSSQAVVPPEVLLAELVGVEGELCPVEEEPANLEEPIAAAKCATVAAPVGDPLCADGGTKCKNPGAKCTFSNGSCGTCHHVITQDATGHRCRGCTCF